MSDAILTARLDDGGLKRALDQLGARAPYATAIALTRTAHAVKKALSEEMKEVFDRPTNYALNSLMVDGATARQQFAVVQFRRYRHSHWLRPQVEGGLRPDKASERQLHRFRILGEGQQIVPGAHMRLDANGNMPGGQMMRILSAVGAATDPYQNQTERSRRRNGARAADMFVMRAPGARQAEGIFERRGDDLLSLVHFIPKPTITPKLDAERVFRTVTRRELPDQVFRAIRHIIERDARRAGR